MGTGEIIGKDKIISQGFLERLMFVLVRLMIKLAFQKNRSVIDAMGRKDNMAHFLNGMSKKKGKWRKLQLDVSNAVACISTPNSWHFFCVRACFESLHWLQLCYWFWMISKQTNSVKYTWLWRLSQGTCHTFNWVIRSRQGSEKILLCASLILGWKLTLQFHRCGKKRYRKALIADFGQWVQKKGMNGHHIFSTKAGQTMFTQRAHANSNFTTHW